MSTAAARKIELVDYHPPSDDLMHEVLEGLSQSQKRLSPKWFYDEEGSRLFDQITRLPEYYPTRTELSILQQYIGEMCERIGNRVMVIEFGAGSTTKVKILLDHLEDPAAFIPVDISGDYLLESAQKLAKEYPDLEILPVCADFTQPFDLPEPSTPACHNLVFFPGSTIGNFSLDAARQLLEVMAIEAGKGGGLLIGVDLRKDKQILEQAYNDGAGITAQFNLNLLTRLNRELGANFDVSCFEHRAVYDEDKGRIEMRLISTIDQVVQIDGSTLKFYAGEYILTECSHKYTLEEFAELAAEAGFKVRKVWTDDDNLFSVQHLVVA